MYSTVINLVNWLSENTREYRAGDISLETFFSVRITLITSVGDRPTPPTHE